MRARAGEGDERRRPGAADEAAQDHLRQGVHIQPDARGTDQHGNEGGRKQRARKAAARQQAREAAIDHRAGGGVAAGAADGAHGLATDCQAAAGGEGQLEDQDGGERGDDTGGPGQRGAAPAQGEQGQGHRESQGQHYRLVGEIRHERHRGRLPERVRAGARTGDITGHSPLVPINGRSRHGGARAMTENLNDSLAFGRITEETRATLRALAPLVDGQIDTILDALYGHVLQWPDLKALFGSEERIKGARERQRQHWRALFGASYDADYIASVRRIAATHARIGLQPSFYISAYLLALEEIHALVLRQYSSAVSLPGARARCEQALRAVDRAILFDLQLVVTAYLEENGRVFRTRLEELADQFEGSITRFADSVVGTAGALKQGAERLQGSADDATRQAMGLTGGAERSSGDMQTVAAATEEITASIGEIARQTQQAAETTALAVGTVERANAIVETLSQAAGRIGDVVGLIQSIAGQTNLLALNATIEAARAGDAGKGFAVVAGEVKSLSGQTARATEDIRTQVGAVQDVVGRIAAAMGEIAQTVDRIREATGAIAGAVEEQGAVTQEISRTLTAAATGAGEITEGARAVEGIAGQTAENARAVAAASAELTEQARGLSEQAAQFSERIRRADRTDGTGGSAARPASPMAA